MLLFLVRHAHADQGEPDELRALSERGRTEAKALAKQLAAHNAGPDLVLTSPLLRARETAKAIADKAGIDVRVDERLAPGTTVELLREAVQGEEGPIAVVGHQPDLSEVAFELTGRDPGFPTGGVVEIELLDRGDQSD